MILQSLFEGKRDTDVSSIEAVTTCGFEDVAENLNRIPRAAAHKWNRILKPILLAYHHETLHMPWRKRLFSYIVEKEIAATQDFDYTELKSLFPEQGPFSIDNALTHHKIRATEQKLPLFQVLREILPTYKDPQESDRITNYREEIVRIYEEVKNRNL